MTLASKLRALGAGVIEFPTIEIREATDYGPLDRAIANLSSYDWLIFTSTNGVRFFVSSRASWITGQVLSIDGGTALF